MNTCTFCYTKLRDSTCERLKAKYKSAADISLYCPNCRAKIRCYKGPDLPWVKPKGFLFRQSSVTGEFYQDEDEDEVLAL